MSANSSSSETNPYSSPIVVDQTTPLPAMMPMPDTAEVRNLFASGRNGAAWFYWVAGLSLVNSIASFTGSEFGFALGLSVTQIADGLAARFVMNGAPTHVRGIALGFDLIVLAMVAGCGWLSQKRVLPVYALGMALYFVDALLFLPFFDIISIAIHGFALLCMWKGFQSYRQLAKLESALIQLP
jgi:hypothetical protein